MKANGPPGSEAPLQAIVDQAAAGLSQITLDGRFVYVNDRYCSLVGRSRAELLTLRMQDLTAPEDLARNVEQIAGMIAEGTSFDIEKRYLRPDGAHVWVRNSITGVRAPDGTIDGLYAASFDITAQKRIEARQSFLLALSDRLQALTEASAVMDAAMGMLGRHLGANRVGYGQVLPDDGTIVLQSCFTDGVAPLTGAYPLDSFGTAITAATRPGEVIACDDVTQDPRLPPAVWAAIDTRAFVSVRLVRDGRMRASLYVNRRMPYAWPAHEVALIADVAARVWDAVERARAEAALRHLNVDLERQVIARSTERGRTWQVTPDLLSVVNREGCFETTNPAWQTVLGWTAEELAGTAFATLLHPDDVARSAAAFEDVKRGVPALRFENRYRRRDGSYRWLSWVAVPEGGKVYCSARDVTVERDRAAELATRTAERDRLWQTSQDLLIVIDTQGVFRAVSPVVTAIIGWTPEALLGRTIFDFMLPEDHQSAAAALEHASRVALPSHENRYRHKDGGTRWLSWVSAPDGELIFAIGRHITAEKQAAEALDRSQARLRTMFETSYQLQGLLTPDGMMVDANATALAVAGVALADIVGRPFWQTPWFTATPGMPETMRDMVTAATQGQSVRQEIAIAVPAGLRCYDLSVRPIHDAGGAVIAIVPEAIDITERRQAEEALRQSQKMEAVGQLTGGLAHDFNNLLTGITGSLEILQTRLAQGRHAELDRYIGAAQGAARRAAALTHRLLAFSRRQTLDPKSTDANRLVAGMAELVRRTVGPSIAVEMVAAADLWATLVDPNQLESALLNLCINARDAMPTGGRLTIETANTWLDDRTARERDMTAGQYVSLSVTDSGTGMPPEVIRRAFDPFFTTKPIGMGTGLGLSMVYGFVRQTGGQARIYSEPGQGTTLCLYFPRHLGQADGPVPPAAQAEPPRAQQGETVLVVDDEPTVRMLVAEVLEDLGYVAIEAGDGAAGLAVLRSDARVDLLITDVGLPGGMNGRQVADAARVIRPALKTLFVTGYAENAAVGNGHLEPGMHVLTKPFAMAALASKIKAIIGGP